MKNVKLLICIIAIFTLICSASLCFATASVSIGVSGTKQTTSTLKQDMSNTASDIKEGISSGISDIKEGAMSAKDNISNGMNSITNDIKDGMDRNSTYKADNTTRNITNNYSTTQVAYQPNNDNISFLGITMSRTSFILLVTALAATVIAILIYSYVTQDNDRYRDEDI